MLEGLFERRDALSWARRDGVPESELLPPFLADALRFERFDIAMGGLQLFTENFVTRWVADAVERTGVRDIAIAGGIFMNVKLNKRIVELPGVRSAFFCPSCGDESNALGAAWVLAMESNDDVTRSEPLPDLYLGPSYSSDEVAEATRRFPFSQEGPGQPSAEHRAHVRRIAARERGRRPFPGGGWNLGRARSAIGPSWPIQAIPKRAR